MPFLCEEMSVLCLFEKNKDEFAEKLKKELKFTPIYNKHSHQTFGECKICGVEN